MRISKIPNTQIELVRITREEFDVMIVVGTDTCATCCFQEDSCSEERIAEVPLGYRSCISVNETTEKEFVDGYFRRVPTGLHDED